MVGGHDADEIIGYITPCGQLYYCRGGGTILFSCISPHCAIHNEEGLPFDGSWNAYHFRVAIAKRERGEPYHSSLITKYVDRRTASVQELERDEHGELTSKLGILQLRIMQRLALHGEWIANEGRERDIYFRMLHRDCPDNRAKHRGQSLPANCCIACYTDEQGAEQHCPLEIEAAELFSQDYVIFPPLHQW